MSATDDSEPQTVIQSNLKDPVEVLPPEVFCHLLHPMPPSSIATASAVCKCWRNLILSDSTLYRCIDLSKFKSRRAIFRHFLTLSSRALHQVEECSLDLSQYLYEIDEDDCDAVEDDYDDDSDDSGSCHESDDSNYDEESSVSYDWSNVYNRQTNFNQTPDGAGEPPSLQALLEALHLSSKSLRIFSLKLDDIQTANLQDELRGSKDSLPFLIPILQTLFEDFSSLQQIKIAAPTYFSLKVGDESLGSKSFQIEDTSCTGKERYGSNGFGVDGSDIASDRLELMQKVRAFTGSGLVEFGGSGWVFGSLHLEIMEELWLSKLTLRTICLGDFNFSRIHLRAELWKNVVMCPNIERFWLSVVPDSAPAGFPAEDTDELCLSRNPSRLSLNLSPFEFPLKGEDLAQLVGNGLEELHLSNDSSDGFFYPILVSYKDTLRDVNLTQVRNWKLPKTLSASAFSYPSLTRLHLDGVDPTILEFFSEVDSPKLQVLSIASDWRYSEGQSLEFFYSILSKNCSNLVDLSFPYSPVYAAHPSSFTAATSHDFTFPKLERLRIGEGLSEVIEFLSRLEYPNLTQIEPPELQDRLKVKAPKLFQALLAEKEMRQKEKNKRKNQRRRERRREKRALNRISSL